MIWLVVNYEGIRQNKALGTPGEAVRLGQDSHPAALPSSSSVNSKLGLLHLSIILYIEKHQLTKTCVLKSFK